MTYQRLAYDDHDTTATMRLDCTACGDRIDVPRQRLDHSRVTMPAPSLDYAAYPREVRKPVIDVDAAAAHLASRLHLHLD